jgi:sugar lactone lactonase YvrE
MHPTVSLAFAAAVLACSADLPTESASLAAAERQAAVFPDVIPLPNGFFPEGIAFGRGATFYVGSISTGAIYRGDARTGSGDILVPAAEGRALAGLEYHAPTGRIYAAGPGVIYAFDAATGATLAVWAAADPAEGPTLVNDLAVLGDALYVTDWLRPVLYRLPLPRDGSLAPAGAVEVLPLTGAVEAIEGFDGNGIVTSPDGKGLIVVSTLTGRLFRVDPLTGATVEIDLGGASLYGGDGMLRIGQTLYVMQGELNQIAVVRLRPDLGAATVERVITHPAYDFPATIAAFGSGIYAVNARFLVEPGADVEYQVVRVER